MSPNLSAKYLMAAGFSSWSPINNVSKICSCMSGAIRHIELCIVFSRNLSYAYEVFGAFKGIMLVSLKRGMFE